MIVIMIDFPSANEIYNLPSTIKPRVKGRDKLSGSSELLVDCHAAADFSDVEKNLVIKIEGLW